MPKWEFYDGSSTYTFEISPNDGGSLDRKKTLTYKSTAAPDGKTLIFEGRDEPLTMSFSGTLLSEEQFDAFNEWFDKRQQIRVKDDLLREFWIYIESFTPRRVRARSHPWKHTYDINATVLDWS